MTFAWPRYRSLVPILAGIHIAFGCAILGIDWTSGMPLWWLLAEGPTIIGFALVVLGVYRRARREGEIASRAG